jgi:hypothetical protein
MSKLSKKDIEELKEFTDRGCEYAGTQEVVNDLVTETLKEIGTEYPYGDEISLFDGDDQFSTVDEFANIFLDKAIEKILNIVETQGE